jgi:hypothetical protein
LILLAASMARRKKNILRRRNSLIRHAFNVLKVAGARAGVAGSKGRPELRQMRA